MHLHFAVESAVRKCKSIRFGVTFDGAKQVLVAVDNVRFLEEV